MTFGALLRLVKLSVRRDVRGALSSVFGVSIGIAALVFFVALGLGIGRVVREKVFPLDAQLVEVVPSQITLGSILGGGKIDQDTFERLRALPGVTAAYRKMNVRVPAVSRYDGDFFGTRLHMGLEVLAVGVDPELVKNDVLMGDFKDPAEGQPVPAIVASRLVDIYNNSFAPNRGLPRLSASLAAGFQFPVEFNRSFVVATRPGPVTAATLQLVGASDRGILAGLTIPLDTAVRLNKASGVDFETFSGVTLQADGPSRVPELVAHVKEMGLKVDEQERRWAENAGAAVLLTTGALALLSLLICLLAAVNIAHALSASVRVRAKELGIMRAVGASKRDVRALIFAEAAVLGAVGGAVGAALAIAASYGLDALALSHLPQFPFKPDTFFFIPPWLPLAGVGLGVLASLAGAWWPSRDAAGIDPARTLAG
ncbi:MAG: ABC transporter permease [Archangiaceae bacterium]|nr:ABC transporter permease [Archangiaceae bacterium]